MPVPSWHLVSYDSVEAWCNIWLELLHGPFVSHTVIHKLFARAHTRTPACAGGSTLHPHLKDHSLQQLAEAMWLASAKLVRAGSRV